MARIAINGLGRIGKLLLRNLIDGGDRVVLVNDPAGDAAGHALLLEFDSVQGRWTTPVTVAGALVGIALMVGRGHGRDHPIPFGPFLAVAGWIVLMWGDALLPAALRGFGG